MYLVSLGSSQQQFERTTPLRINLSFCSAPPRPQYNVEYILEGVPGHHPGIKKKTTLKLGEWGGMAEEPSAVKTIQAKKKLRLIFRGVGRLEVNCYVSGVLMLDWDNC